MNKFIISGRLTRDPEKKSSETLVVRYRLAVKKEMSKDVDFLDFVVFKNQAEFALKYFKKGSNIIVEGKIEPRIYEKDGKTYYVTDLIVNHQEFA